MTYVENGTNIRFPDLLKLIQNRIMTGTSYFGIPTYKNPLDFWVYQEIIFEKKPDVIVEIGNCFGGSTLALAHILDHLSHGRVIGIDISQTKIVDLVRNHPRITLVEGDACAVFNNVAALISSTDSVLVIEDSAHTYDHTLKVLETYSGLIHADGYFIVEDGICHHGVEVGPSPGPYEACEFFAKNYEEFEIDRSRESFCITWNPKGYLHRKSNVMNN